MGIRLTKKTKEKKIKKTKKINYAKATRELNKRWNEYLSK